MSSHSQWRNRPSVNGGIYSSARAIEVLWTSKDKKKFQGGSCKNFEVQICSLGCIQIEIWELHWQHQCASPLLPFDKLHIIWMLVVRKIFSGAGSFSSSTFSPWFMTNSISLAWLLNRKIVGLMPCCTSTLSYLSATAIPMADTIGFWKITVRPFFNNVSKLKCAMKLFF